MRLCHRPPLLRHLCKAVFTLPRAVDSPEGTLTVDQGRIFLLFVFILQEVSRRTDGFFCLVLFCFGNPILFMLKESQESSPPPPPLPSPPWVCGCSCIEQSARLPTLPNYFIPSFLFPVSCLCHFSWKMEDIHRPAPLEATA